MTDWDRVERLRAKGRNWNEIASDARVGFRPDEGAGEPGHALKALYFQRKSRSHRSARDEQPSSPSSTSPHARRPPPDRWFRRVSGVGFGTAVAALVPLAVVLLDPSLTPVIPLLALICLAVAGVALVILVWLSRRDAAWVLWRRSVAIGVAVGVGLVGVLFVLSLSNGCPSLSTATTAEPGPSGDHGWKKAGNPVWKVEGLPVLFYYSAAGCPYCAAVSWAVRGAVQNFSTSLSGTSYTTSNPYEGPISSIPEVDFVGSTSTGSYVSWNSHEGPETQSVVLPSLACPESAYVSAYDQGPNNGCEGVPLLVVAGVYLHVGFWVTPTVMAGLTASQISTDLSQGDSGNANSVWNAVHPAQVYIEAYLLAADRLAGVSPPAGMASNAEVLSAIAGIS